MPHRVDDFLQRAYERSLPAMRVCDASAQDADALLLERRGRLYEALQLRRWYAEGFEPRVEPRDATPREGFTLREGDLHLLEGLTTPLYVLTPDRANGKAILYANGHGLPCADILRPENRAYYTRYLPALLAQRGYTVYLHEPIGFGDVTHEGYREPEGRGCYAIATFLLQCGANLAGLRVYQALRVLDLMARTFRTLGMTGISGGGMVTALTLPLTRRVQAAAVLGYASRYRESIMAMNHCVDNFVPGMLAIGEEADLLAMAHPCRLLLSAGDADPIFPIASARATAGDVERFYRRMGTPGDFAFDAFEGAHVIHAPAVLDWFDGRL